MVLNTKCACGGDKNPNAKRCWACANESRRQALLGKAHSAERRLVNSLSHRGEMARFDLASVTRGKPAHNRVEVGHRRRSNGHWQVKCADGQWRYEHRVVWEAAHGPIPRGIVIHHINHDPFDNRLNNLVALTNGSHMSHHIEGRAPEMQQRSVAKRNARKAVGGHY